MMKRNEQGGTVSNTGKGVGQIEAVFEVDTVSHAVAEATEATSPPLGDVSTFDARSDVEQVDSRSRLELDEVDPISRDASAASLIRTLQSSFCLVDDAPLSDL